jgi:hypothetical protein
MMQTQYENQGGLLVKPGTNECAGYIFNFAGHGAYQPIGKVETSQGPADEEITTHNAILANAELQATIARGKGTFYLSYIRPECSPDNPRWKQMNAGTWHYTKHSVAQWTGKWKAAWCYVRTGYSYGFCRVETNWVWFTGPDGKKWYGVNKGDMACFTGRRLKNQ